eukprot:jgi/Galph1/6102/GphlegSOOS_G4648.1
MKQEKQKNIPSRVVSLHVILYLLVFVGLLYYLLEPESMASASLKVYSNGFLISPKKYIEDASCDVHTLHWENAVKLNRKLSNLVARTFFRIFKVDLTKECPFWPDDGQCALRDCSVCACSEDEIPVFWRIGDNNRKSSFSFKSPVTCETANGRDTLNDVDRNLGTSFNYWKEEDDNVWIIEDNDDTMIYVDLLANVERYTGYQGESAARIWKAIYNENCFLFPNECSGQEACSLQEHYCKEQRVFFRLISGIHTSINMHIAKEYLFGTRWGPNLKLYEERVRKYPERVENLYFAFAFVLRAVSKESPILSPEAYDYRVGNETEDELTKKTLREIFSCSKLLTPECLTFDERALFRTNEGRAIQKQFKEHFRNISAIMDCVGCEKCRLWGKLQFLGVGTALKILFDERPDTFQHNEVSSLFNVLHKLSTSVLTISFMERLRFFIRIRQFLFVVESLLMVELVVLISKRLPPRWSRGKKWNDRIKQC